MIDLKCIDPDKLYSNEETAAFYQITPASLTSKRSRGEGATYVKLGRAVFYTGRAILDDILADQRRPSPSAQRKVQAVATAEA